MIPRPTARFTTHLRVHALAGLALLLLACSPRVTSSGTAIEATPLASIASDVPTLADCTFDGDASLGIFSQPDGTIDIAAYNVAAASTSSIWAVADETGDVLTQQAVANEYGAASTTFTLPDYDYMRWHLFLQHDEGMHCEYVVISGNEWLEQGAIQPTTASSADGTPAEGTLQSEEEALMQDAALAGLPIEDALLSEELESAVIELDARLRRNEAETYTGLRAEWEPSYRVVLSFTEDGEATLAQYLDPDSKLAQYVKVETVEYSQAELDADRQAIETTLAAAPWGWSSYTSGNRVHIDVPTEELWQQFIEENNVDVPPSVVVNFAYDSIPTEPPAGVTVAPDVYLATWRYPAMMFNQALLEAQLVLEDGCLFAKAENGRGRLLIAWQPGHFPVERGGEIVVVDEYNEVVATVGETVGFGGSEISLPDDDKLVAPVPEACVTTNVWNASPF